ncbi:kinase-like protein [Leucogyrophana mollusca]|uniref:Kinase-like protein n=1 Tax=Leucogyrophana mollusca TaxID=85980 RepID=A0ACB8BA45_9AGAM|nr:kinase-like protein [Leucogyrophana mollusca]
MVTAEAEVVASGNTREDPPDLTGQIERTRSHPVACGGFGDVWRCIWRRDIEKVDVAVKVIRAPYSTEEDQKKKGKRLRRELKIWMMLDRHENVLPLYGVTSEFGPLLSMVCPWKDNGTLNTYLAARHAQMTIEDQFDLLRDIVSGLRYLHSRSIVHGDLSGSNILIDAQGKACLADFGLSTLIIEFQGTSYFTSSLQGAVRWTAPELYEVHEDNDSPLNLPTKASDIYSFGCVAFQVLTGEVPYRYLKNDAQVILSISKGIRPKCPTNCSIAAGHWHFLDQCWSHHMLDRPTMDAVVVFVGLEALSRVSVQSDGQTSLDMAPVAYTPGVQQTPVSPRKRDEMEDKWRPETKADGATEIVPPNYLHLDPETNMAPEAYLHEAMAIYAYTASPDDPNEISFTKGEILHIADMEGKWWRARKADGTTGVAPSDHLRIDAPGATSAPDTHLLKAVALYAYTASPDDPNDISFDKGEILHVTDVENDWWWARKADGTTGFAPSNFLRIDAPGATTAPTHLRKAVTLYAYTASPNDPNEISFDKGEILHVADVGRDWWWARKSDGTTGIVLFNCLRMGAIDVSPMTPD